MADNNFGELVNSLMKGMNGVLSSKTVVGEPTQVGDATIIPLVDVSFGLGAGSGIGEKKDNGGGGIGGKMTPSAVLIIQNGHTKLVNVKNQDSFTKLVDMLPEVLDRFSKDKVEVDNEQAIDAAFPEDTQQ
ncbi:MAG: GerW family sporulation protein [Lachnospiraceae bacterium]|nr:GerW family sporulation protein [Lachnospiraceae bacterium]